MSSKRGIIRPNQIVATIIIARVNVATKTTSHLKVKSSIKV